MFRATVGLILAGVIVIAGLWMLASVLIYILIPILGVIGALLGLG